MAVVADTNIFLRILQPHHPHRSIAERALGALRARGEVMNVAPQNLVELWAVATRPVGENGLGLTSEQTAREIDQIKRLWTLLPEVPLFEEWERLVRTYQVCGRNTHDARLAAAMYVHGIENILTFNGKDFVRYTEIKVIDPAS